jgi:hypothetical protein
MGRLRSDFRHNGGSACRYQGESSRCRQPRRARSAQLAAVRPAYLCTAVLNEECAHLPRVARLLRTNYQRIRGSAHAVKASQACRRLYSR